ncbi:MAG: glycosyltransferase family 39 protein [Thermodesulfovibrionales bacterium]|nr:glycosyltransferase family 39 protein [Thermodesulfovibrionales bacterium]
MPGLKDEGNIRFYACIISAYLLLTLIVTYPLIAKFTTHCAGEGGDEQVYLWNFWWMKYSLIDLKANPLYTDYIFYPNEVGLAFHTLMPLNGLLSIPLQYIMGIITIHNLFVVLSFAISGFGAFLLINYITGDWRAAFVGGVIYAFCPYKLAHTSGNLAATEWMPFYALFMIRTFEEDGRWKNPLLAGLMLGFNFLSEYLYFFLMVMLTVLFVLFKIAADRKETLRYLRKGLLIALFSLPLVLPVLSFAVGDILAGNIKKLPLPNADFYVADLLGFFSPSPRNPVIGRFSILGYFTGSGQGLVYLGFSVMALALLGWLKYHAKNRMAVFFGICFLFFTVFSLGPHPHLLGKTYNFPLPFQLIAKTPVLKQLRAPARFNIASMLCLSVLAAYGIRYLLEKRKYATILIMMPLLAVEYAAVPIPMQKSPIPAVYEEISRDTDAQAVLEVPFFVSDGYGPLGAHMPAIQFYQTAHRKKIMNGYISRVPERVFWSYLNLPVLRNLAIMGWNLPVEPENIEVDKKIAEDVINLFGIDYVVVHKGFETEAMHSFLKYILQMKKIYEDEKTVAYKTFRRGADGLVIDAGTETSIPYLMAGWINGQKEGMTTYAWSAGKESVLLLNLSHSEDYEMTLRMKPHDGLKKKGLKVSVNKRFLSGFHLKDGWCEYSVSLPRQALKNGLNKITFRYEDAVLTKGDFGGIWTKGSLSGLMEHMGLGDLEVSKLSLNWEQDNRKLSGSPVSVALDYVTVKEMP